MTSKKSPPLKQQQLKSEYNALKSKQDQWNTIQTLNKLYKVDRILLKHAYDNYKQKQTLEASKQYKEIQKFYKYVLNNLFSIEKDYLTDELTSLQGQNKSNYEINKNSTSKFIRDQKQYYQSIFKKYEEKINQQQSGINGQNIYQFVKQCFNTKFTQVIIDGQPYFGDQSRKQQFEATIKQYHLNYKDIQEKDFVLSNLWMEEHQILDFLSEWLKANQDNQLYVLYCRTQEKLKGDAMYLKSQALKNKKKEQMGEKLNVPSHPVIVEKEQIQNAVQIMQQIQNNQPVDEHQQQKPKEINGESKPVNNILQRFRKNKFVAQQQIQTKQKVKVLTKKQQFTLKLPQLFLYGCKRRYPLPKGTTFDQIQTQSKTMNLQKFINFCNHFEINKYLSRQLLSQIFKINALNRLTIDQKRFCKIMQAIASTDQRCIDCFLGKKSIQHKIRSQSKLSDYKFALRPVNGKCIQQLQVQLNQKKIIKSKSKQQKLNLHFLNKMKAKQKNQRFHRKQKAKSTLSSRILPQSTNILELQNMRDDRFDPQKFFGNDNDELLDLYQSKYQSKIDSRQPMISPLQSILSKRLQKGNRILQKMNSQQLKYYQ